MNSVNSILTHSHISGRVIMTRPE